MSANSLKSDPSKIAVIHDRDPPLDRKELETILGMTNDLAKFSQNLLELTDPVRQLMSSTSDFMWDDP